MKKFNYTKWKAGTLPGLMVEQGPASGSGTGSGTGSGASSGSGTGSTTGSATASSCDVHQGASTAVASAYPNPQLGDHGINQNFVNNMQGKSTQFYNQRINQFVNKINQLSSQNPVSANSYQLFCQGSNPMWQAQLYNRAIYADTCRSNPGTC